MAAKVSLEGGAAGASLPRGHLAAALSPPLVLLALVLSFLAYPVTAGADAQSDAFSEAMQPLSLPSEQQPPSQPATETPPEPEQPEPTIAPEEGPQQPSAEQPEPSALPEPSPDTEVISLQADDLYYTSEGTQAWGKVRVGYQDYRASGEILDIDKERVWIKLRGDVVVTSPDMLTTADNLELNLDTEHWHAFDTRTKVEPSFFESGVVEPLYLDGRHIHGCPGQIEVNSGRGTSCDLPHKPHYWLQSSYIRVEPEEYVVFRKPALYLLGHRIFRYPWDLRLSLRRHTNRFLPEVGENEVEGYFAKFAYLYLLNEQNSGVLRLHLTQKRGTGYGFDHDFDFGANYGDLRFFGEPSQGSWSGRLSDTHQFSESFTADLSSNIQRYSGYEAGSTSFSSNLSFRNRSTDGQSLLGFQHSIMKSAYSTNKRLTVNMTHRQQASEDYSWEVRNVMRRNDYLADQRPDEELNTEFRLRGRERSYNWEAITKKRYDLDGSAYTGDDNFYSLDYLPELQMNTDTSRLGGYRLFGTARVRASLNLGRFKQQPENMNVSRAAIDISLPGHSRSIGGSKKLHNSLRFRQQFFSDGSAQYYTNFRTELRGKWGHTWDHRWSFNFGSSHGYSPLRLGYAGKSSYLNFQAVRTVRDKMRIDVGSGYDFVNNYYRDATFRGQFMLAPDSRLELQTSYSLDRSEWRPVNARWLRATDNWYSAITSYYDLDESKLTRATSEINWRVNKLWHIDVLAGYSGYTHKLDQFEVQVLRDLHCMLASVTYDKELNEFRINVGIKAFPSNERQFGVGAGGPRFESTFGQYY